MKTSELIKDISEELWRKIDNLHGDVSDLTDRLETISEIEEFLLDISELEEVNNWEEIRAKAKELYKKY